MTIPAAFEGMLVVDSDTHLTEPHDLWTKRAPGRLRDRLPRVEIVDGEPSWVVGRDLIVGRAGASGVVARDGQKSKGTDWFAWTIDEIHPGAHLVPERLQAMDQMGVWAQIVYPNAFGFAGTTMGKVDDDELRMACVTIYNDAMAEMQEESGGRLLPMAAMPFWSIDAAVAEAKRCAGLGLRGINTTSAPHEFGAPDYAESAWNPFWETCVEYQMPVNFHIGAASSDMDWYGAVPWPSLAEDQKLGLGSAMMYLNNAKVLGNIIYSGVLERFPDLQVVSVESAVGWLPFLFEALEYQMGEMPRSKSHLSLTPLEYFQRQMYACFWFERKGINHVIDRLGHDKLMFETDFPHPTCTFPNGLDIAAEALAAVDDASVRADLIGNNAARLYRIEAPATTSA
ncbi:hypothetical protein A5761_09840 [Mycolicibacterium setense]|uniref:amidohydrolase family protein n=1 Tax=Mycolicibacterium setense TaxID=431269 RepID=UPI0007EC100F|nr:amidohydrolase family protein [Mycolicibacterium setense]OBB17649.1 hypothetical protein A5761_09840 [Mycolicibacterium setense]